MLYHSDMAQKFDLEFITDYSQGYVRLNETTEIKRRYVIHTTIGGAHAYIDVEHQDDGSPRCLSVRVEAPPVSASDDDSILGEHFDPGVTTTLLQKIPVGELISRSRKSSLIVAEAGGVHDLSAPVPETRPDLTDRFGIGKRRPRRGKPLTDRHLKAVAAEYRAAVASGDQPAKRICEVAMVERPTAARWIRAARDRGFLGEAMPGKAGEREA